MGAVELQSTESKGVRQHHKRKRVSRAGGRFFQELTGKNMADFACIRDLWGGDIVDLKISLLLDVTSS